MILINNLGDNDDILYEVKLKNTTVYYSPEKIITIIIKKLVELAEIQFKGIYNNNNNNNIYYLKIYII
jgi:hypothetical protein